VGLVRNNTSTHSIARLSIGSTVEEAKEEEIIRKQYRDVEMLNVDQIFMFGVENQEEAHSQHVFIQ
jgi:hypothetical protein